MADSLEFNAAGHRDPFDAGDNPNKITLSCLTEYKQYTYNEKHDIWSLVSLKAACQDEKKRSPIDIVTVIDKSGSMSGFKLNLVKKTLEFVLTQLNEKDRLSIVTYDTDVYLDYTLHIMNKDNKQNALEKINKITEGSCTNLCGGLMKGLCQIIDRGNDKNDVASVLLFTDGLANSGITKASGITQAMKDPKRFDGPSGNASDGHHPQQHFHAHQGPKAAIPQQQSTTTSNQEKNEKVPVSTGKATNATVYTFGFGDDHDPEMLKEISDAGNGMYYYIENEDKIAESFGHCLGGLLSTVAQGIQLQIIMEDGVSIKAVHSGKPFEESTDKKSVKVNLGDLQSEENRDIVLELTLDDVNTPYEITPQPLFTATVNYFNIISDNLESINGKLSVFRSEKFVPHDASSSNVLVNKERARVKMTKAMQQAKLEADRGDLDCARSLLATEIKGLKSERSSVRHDAVENVEEYEDVCTTYDNMMKDLEQCTGNLTDMKSWMSKGSKLQTNLMQQHVYQRNSTTNSASYVTTSKEKSKRAAKTFVNTS